jgi:hypothetical protein
MYKAFLLLAILSCSLSNIYAQADSAYDEVIVSVNIQGVGNIEIPAIIKVNTIYLPAGLLFDELRIKNTYSNAFDSLYGFFINTDSTYLIDDANSKILFAKRTYQLDAGAIVKTELGLYVRSDLYGQIFGLQTSFNFHSLLVRITTKLELPIMREARLNLMRANANKLKGTQIADTTIKRTYPLFHFGVLDWSVVSNQLIGATQDTRFNLGLGGILAGGETNVLLNYSLNSPFSEKMQYYQWKYVDNDNKYVKQVLVGKIATPTVASIYAPVVGVQLTNIPTTVKRAFGYYTLTNITNPGWIVELYVNNVLIDYKKADGSGFFTFEVPLVFGSSAIKLRFYGPYGEERSREESITIPFNFLTQKQFQYTVTGGLVEDDSNSKFSKAVFNYGLTKRITVGTGMEYLSSVNSGNFMPFATTSVRLGRGIMLAGEYNYNVRARGALSFRTRSNMQFEFNYSRYDKNQTAINTQVLEERKAVIAIPIRTNRFSIFSQATINQSLLANTGFLTAEWLLSGFLYGVDVHLSTYGIYYQNTEPNVYSNFSLAFRIPFQLIFTSQAQYKYNTNQVVSIKESFERNVSSRTYVGLYYEENFNSNIQNIGLQFRYNFSFAQVGVSSMITNRKLALLESARGSVIFDTKTKYVGTSNNNSSGRGGIVIAPFLDLNCNGVKDAGEAKVSGLKFRMSGGTILPEGKDTLIRIVNLEPYNNYYIELNRFSFDNIAWQIRKLTINVAADANKFTLVNVPVSVVAEVNGSVYLEKNKNRKGQGQLYVCFYRDDKLVAKTLTEPDGYFSYIGLAPGHYTAVLDPVQMTKVKMRASEGIPFNVLSNADGDVIDGLEFTVTPMDQKEEIKE